MHEEKRRRVRERQRAEKKGTLLSIKLVNENVEDASRLDDRYSPLCPTAPRLDYLFCRYIEKNIAFIFFFYSFTSATRSRESLWKRGRAQAANGESAFDFPYALVVNIQSSEAKVARASSQLHLATDRELHVLPVPAEFLSHFSPCAPRALSAPLSTSKRPWNMHSKSEQKTTSRSLKCSFICLAELQAFSLTVEISSAIFKPLPSYGSFQIYHRAFCPKNLISKTRALFGQNYLRCLNISFCCDIYFFKYF